MLFLLVGSRLIGHGNSRIPACRESDGFYPNDPPASPGAGVLSVSVFYLASWCRLPDGRTEHYMNEYGVQLGDVPTDETPI